MLRHASLSLMTLLVVTGTAFGDIYVWEGSAANCTIDDGDNTIQINAAGTYGFRAWDPGTQALEEIQDASVNSSVTGTVTVKIAYDSNGNDGATDIWELDLTAGSGTGNLAKLDISGDLGTVSTIVCDNITDVVDIDGSIGVMAGTRKFSVDNATAAIVIHGTIRGYNSLEANTLGDRLRPGGKMESSPGEQRVVALIQQLRGCGLSLRQIARQLACRGLRGRHGQPLSAKTIRAILRRPA